VFEQAVIEVSDT